MWPFEWPELSAVGAVAAVVSIQFMVLKVQQARSASAVNARLSSASGFKPKGADATGTWNLSHLRDLVAWSSRQRFVQQVAKWPRSSV